MKPEDTSHQTHSTPQPRNGVNVPERESAVDLIRGQLDALYGSQTEQNKPQTPSQSTTPTASAPAQAAPAIDPDQWKQYHSAWQDYYQKYYQHYYTNYAHKVIKEREEELAAHATRQTAPPIAQPTTASTTSDEPVADSTKKEELSRLRKKLLNQAQQSAKKVRHSRHFIPALAAVSVVLIFSFMQYNQLLMGNVQAYISPGAISPQNIVVDPTTDVTVNPDPKLVIPKLNIDVPVVYGIGADDKSQLDAMQHGVAHWPGSDWAKSVPGQVGNTVIAAHSSNDLFEPGDYKFVFSQLDRLQNGDTIYANYQGKRYTYTVTAKNIIKADEWQSVIKPTDKPVLVLVTCWPIGTSQKRLLVTADQVVPDPNAATAAPKSDDSNVPTTANMTGNSPTLLESFFNLFK